MDEKNSYKHRDRDQSGGFLLLNKKEREILREILARSLSSPEGRHYIKNTLGEEYVRIGLDFLKSIGG